MILKYCLKSALLMLALLIVPALAAATASADIAAFNFATLRSATSVAPIETAARTPAIQRKSSYDSLIAKHARANGVPVALAHAVIEVESRYNPGARGRSGEVGLMQILPRTARGIGYRGTIKALYRPDTNLHWGMKYLGEAYRRGGKSVCGAIMKYNAGHYAQRHTKWTRAYCAKVKRILRNAGGSA